MNSPASQTTPAPNTPHAPLPRVLLIEDDPVSCAVLTAAVLAVPAQVDSADSVAGALLLADQHDYALWLLDANLPDGSGAQLLGRLRAAHPLTPALAHTATNDPATLDTLIAAGFLQVLVKPLPAATIHGAVRRALGRCSDGAGCGVALGNAGGKPPVWDDDAAMRALNGQCAHVTALRGLFLGELPGLRQAVNAAALVGDCDAVRASLHKLRASCGFVGAARLAAAANALHDQAQSPALLARFDDAAQDTLDAANPTVGSHGQGKAAPVGASGSPAG